jgi:glycosyltransferase involved in cell wall biosynthesis
MNYYFTFNDSYSGVYHSQVIDVVKLYQSKGVNMKLIAMVSPRNFFSDRAKILEFIPDAIVIPSIPKLKNWKKNTLLLNLATKKNSLVICRGVFATNIALNLKNKFSNIVYDGRGAIKAEQEEYGVYSGTGIEEEIAKLESNAVLESDSQIAVSSKLIDYWIKEYGYKGDNNKIIPCSVADSFNNVELKKDSSLIDGLEEDDVLLIYSGSLAGWQSLDNLEEVLSAFLKNEKVKILFLSKSHTTIEELQNKYPNRIFRKWLSPIEVPRYLALGDYGILLRKDNWTNRVASPVKFAEYLSAGLKVLISKSIGDFSDLVRDNNLGIVVDSMDIDSLQVSIEPMYASAVRIKEFAKNNFSKESVSKKYLEIIE